ncbi:ChaN family lipoprotein [Phaeovulum sp.]|uniref:ChaN family lipoprotein n=1 Tax=Phaeovulum sp. TaxID=2934796 RepID=UPI00356445EB
MKIITVLALAVFTTFGPGAAAMAEQIEPEALPGLQAPVVILGEVHDNPAHHANQALALAFLRPSAIVFEMLSEERASYATPANRESAEKLEAALGWEDAGWPDFDMYYQIFEAAPEATIRGADVPREALLQAMRDGAAAAFGGDAARYGLTQPFAPEVQAELEAEQMRAHCDALPPERMAGMVEAQRLRDASLARAVLEALAETGGPVAVITGSGHARRDFGVPAVLQQAAPDVSVLSIGQIEAPADPVQPFDYWIVTEPAPRDDPCAVFR